DAAPRPSAGLPGTRSRGRSYVRLCSECKSVRAATARVGDGVAPDSGDDQSGGRGALGCELLPQLRRIEFHAALLDLERADVISADPGAQSLLLIRQLLHHLVRRS